MTETSNPAGAITVSLYRTMRGHDIFVLSGDDGSIRTLNPLSWKNGVPALVDVLDFHVDPIDTAKRPRVLLATTLPRLSFFMANGRTVNELVQHEEHFVHTGPGVGFVAIKTGDPDNHFNTTVYGVDDDGRWATRNGPLACSGRINSFRLCGNDVTVTKFGRPCTTHYQWIFDIVSGELLKQPTTTTSVDKPAELVSAGV